MLLDTQLDKMDRRWRLDLLSFLARWEDTQIEMNSRGMQ